MMWRAYAKLLYMVFVSMKNYVRGPVGKIETLFSFIHSLNSQRIVYQMKIGQSDAKPKNNQILFTCVTVLDGHDAKVTLHASIKSFANDPLRSQFSIVFLLSSRQITPRSLFLW